MAKTEEGKIQDAVIRYAGKKGIRHIRLYFGPGMQTGWPDVMFLIPGGYPLFIEFKALGKKPTEKQKVKIKILWDLDYDVYVCDNVEDGKRFIDAPNGI